MGWNVKLIIRHHYRVWRYTFSNLRNVFRFIKTAPDESKIKHVPSMTVFEVKEKMDKGELVILDVRGPRDFKEVRIEGSIHMNMFEVLDNLDKLPKDKKIGVICYGGGASMTVTEMLIENGFEKTKNIKGGIIRYALDVDNSLLELF